MKPHLRKTILSSTVLTAGFAIVVATIAFGGVRGPWEVTIFGSVVMALALAISIGVCSRS